LGALSGPARFEPAVEAEFVQDYSDRTIAASRIPFIGGAAMYAAFGLLDLWLLPETHDAAWLLRFGVGMPFYLVMIAMSLVPALQRWTPLIYAATIAVCGITIVGMIRLAHHGEIGQHMYFAGLMVVHIGGYVFLGLRYKAATTANLLILLAFEAASVTQMEALATPDGKWHFISINFFLVAANMLGMASCYRLEHLARRDFALRREIGAQRAQSEALLLNILPKKIASVLKTKPQTIAESFPSASVLFADVVGFTPIAEHISPSELIELLNEVFSYFDNLANKYGVEKIKTIGDCYMAAAGVPVYRPDHAQALGRMALEIQEHVREHDFLGRRLRFRIGINSGPVVAGVIGRMKFSYDLWGDVVNTASRMESHGRSGVIQITRGTYELLGGNFVCVPQGSIPVKGKGNVEVWHLLGEQASGSSPLPPSAACDRSRHYESRPRDAFAGGLPFLGGPERDGEA